MCDVPVIPAKAEVRNTPYETLNSCFCINDRELKKTAPGIGIEQFLITFSV
jgi:hypothetical protein